MYLTIIQSVNGAKNIDINFLTGSFNFPTPLWPETM